VPLEPVSELHFDLVARLESLNRTRGIRDVWLAPRGSAKSTWSTFAYPIYSACYSHERYIVLTADTGPQAEKYLDSIRTEFEHNRELANEFPHVRPGRVWRSNAVELTNGVKIEALGTGAKVRGRRYGAYRPTCIIVDDPQNLMHVISPLQRSRSMTWINKDVCNAGSPLTNILVLGTALHRECIVCTLQVTPGWNARLYRSIIEWPKRMDLWGMWESILRTHDDPNRAERARLFYEANEAAMNE
jgi:hypothetical protein